jgi:CHAD domain-containing protein
MQIEGTTPLWIAARVLLYERADDFSRRRDKVLKTYEAEDIHDLRVASRRLREGLALFAPCYPPMEIARLVGKIRRVTRLLGDIRNADEALLFFTALAAELDGSCRSGLEELTRAFQKNRKKALNRLRVGLRKVAPGSLRDLCLRVINSPALFSPPADGVDLFAPLSGFAREALDARLADVMKLMPVARHAGEVEAQHLLRISVKHFRYRMEILAMLLGTHFEELYAALKSYQEVLGKMHDLDVFAGIVRKEDFSPETEKLVLDAIAARRATFFKDFTGMLEAVPFESIGERMRHAL